MKRKPIRRKLDDLFNHALVGTLPRLLAVGTPDTAKGAMLWASANGLHRRPHVFLWWDKIPARR